jgi:hypothetical protein
MCVNFHNQVLYNYRDPCLLQSLDFERKELQATTSSFFFFVASSGLYHMCKAVWTAIVTRFEPRNATKTLYTHKALLFNDYLLSGLAK